MDSALCERCGLSHLWSVPCPVVTQLPVAQAPQLLARGTRVGGRFRVHSVAHQNGRSTVYRAEDIRNQGLPVALKEFNAEGLPAAEQTEMLGWLAREAGLLSLLTHPQLPRLTAAFSEADRHYVVMPFLDGYTLEELIARRGQLPEALTLGWARSLADLLSYLHTQEPPIIHRDLKPANVLVRPDGSVTLLDLGVARAVVPGSTGTAVGTPGYAAPEQYHGLADPRSDLYALGATMHRALTGYDTEHQPPFRQPPVREMNAAISAETAALVDQLLRVAPDQRPTRAQEVSHAVSGILRSVYTRPLLTMYRQILALLAVAMLLGAALYHWTIAGFAVHMGYAPAPPSFPNDSFTASLNPHLSYLHLNVRDAFQLVMLTFAPAVLCFIPLFQTRVRALSRRDATLKVYWQRAFLTLLALWLLPLAVWITDLNLVPAYDTDWVLQPGAVLLSAPLALGSGLFAAMLLIRQYAELRSMRVGVQRLRWFDLLLRLGGLFLAWSVILIVQEMAIHSW